MGSRSYRRLLTILEKWPIDAEKSEGRDLGSQIRSKVPAFFPTGDVLAPDSSRTPEECDADLRALEDIVNNKAKNLYSRDEKQAKFGALRHDLPTVQMLTSTEGLKDMGGIDSEEGSGYLSSLVTGVFERRKTESGGGGGGGEKGERN